MYLDNLYLSNIKCFEHIEIHFQSAAVTDNPQSNWNVILGNNGDGKTTLLQAIAACLMDTTTTERLLKPDNWVRTNHSLARLSVDIIPERFDKQQGRPTKDIIDLRLVEYIIVAAGQDIPLGSADKQVQFFATATILEPTPDYQTLFDDAHYSVLLEDIDFLKRNAFQRQTKRGWFSCGYGAFRRISGFSTQMALVDDHLQKRFLTLFEEGAALYDCERWLKDLQRKATKSNRGSRSRDTLAEVKQLLLQLLPGVDDMTIGDELQFKWQNSQVGLHQLSDGYRSMFALGADLLRWLDLMRPSNIRSLGEMGGIVLIDEIDSHLHPKWQRQVGFLLTKVFPNIQFIVATHSPFVAMAAGEKALTVLEKEGDVVTANQNVPKVQGWAVDQVVNPTFWFN